MKFIQLPILVCIRYHKPLFQIPSYSIAPFFQKKKKNQKQSHGQHNGKQTVFTTLVFQD